MCSAVGHTHFTTLFKQRGKERKAFWKASSCQIFLCNINASGKLRSSGFIATPRKFYVCCKNFSPEHPEEDDSLNAENPLKTDRVHKAWIFTKLSFWTFATSTPLESWDPLVSSAHRENFTYVIKILHQSTRKTTIPATQNAPWKWTGFTKLKFSKSFYFERLLVVGSLQHQHLWKAEILWFHRHTEKFLRM